MTSVVTFGRANQAGLKSGQNFTGFERHGIVAVLFHDIDLSGVARPDKDLHLLHVLRGEHRLPGKISDPAGVHSEEHDEALRCQTLFEHGSEPDVHEFEFVKVVEHHRQALEAGNAGLDFGQTHEIGRASCRERV